MRRSLAPKSIVISKDAEKLLQSGNIDALIEFHRKSFGDLRMEEDDGDGGDDDDDDNDATGGADGVEDDSDGGAGGKDEGKDKKSDDLQAENARRRHENKKLKSEMDQLKLKLKQFEDADKGDLEKAQGELTTLTAERDKLAEVNRTLSIQNAFLMENKYTWVDPQAALKLADLENIEIDEDGEVSGMAQALEALAKSKPYLLKKSKDDDDDDDDTGTRSTGLPPGKKSRSNPNRDKLVEKYPALRR